VPTAQAFQGGRSFFTAVLEEGALDLGLVPGRVQQGISNVAPLKSPGPNSSRTGCRQQSNSIASDYEGFLFFCGS
jgi:hypothetical protein